MLQPTRSRLLLALLALFALVVAACGSDSTDDAGATDAGDETTTTTEADEDLPPVTLYSGRDVELIQPIIDKFTEETGIEVIVEDRGNSAATAALLLEEGDRTSADVFLTQEVGAIGELSKAGLLAELPQDVIDQVAPRFQPGADNTWVGVTGRSRVIVYNPELVDEAPTSTLELTDEKWRGKVAIVPGNAGFQAFVTAFRVSQGEDAAKAWLEGMIANDAQIYEGNSAVLDAVDAGDVAVGLINHYYLASQLDEREFTAQLVFPAGDDPGGLVNATAVGILKGAADNPSALKLVEFLISQAGQEYFVAETAEYPVRPGVANPAGVPALDELEGPALDLTDLDSLKATQALLTEVGLLS